MRALLIAAGVDCFAAVAAVAAVNGTDCLLGKHFAVFIPLCPRKERPTRKCVVCWKHGVRCESCYQRKQCMQKPALCVDPCFEKYHTTVVYKSGVDINHLQCVTVVEL